MRNEAVLFEREIKNVFGMVTKWASYFTVNVVVRK